VDRSGARNTIGSIERRIRSDSNASKREILAGYHAEFGIDSQVEDW
jgi:hypothetical protein